MRFRRSSNPKLILGSESAIDGASAVVRGGRIPLVERDGSNDEDMMDERETWQVVEVALFRDN